ncbi:MAG: septum formation inhibitor Maf [Magnetococcales bacterium]|nr:septum formation inhibitor Maf [Magnetococcales bacterium]
MRDKKPLPWLEADYSLCLASASPRRLELLRQVGIEPFIYPTKVDETVLKKETPKLYAKRMAITKAKAGLQSGYKNILGADTVVVLNGKILGKPKDEQDAINMLTRLSGQKHHVLTAIAMILQNSSTIHSRTVKSDVWFKKNTEAEIAAYVATQEPFDKAGSYAIQGVGSFMVEKIAGSYSGVVGLPLFETLQLLINSN